MKGFPHGIGMQTLNSPNLNPVQDGPDREDHKSIIKNRDGKSEKKQKQETTKKERPHFKSSGV
jgi:hypothetical protein